MKNLHTIDGEVVNFGKLHDPDEQGEIRVVQMPSREEIHSVIGAR